MCRDETIRTITSRARLVFARQLGFTDAFSERRQTLGQVCKALKGKRPVTGIMEFTVQVRVEQQCAPQR
jgi:hypothetical protein